MANVALDMTATPAAAPSTRKKKGKENARFIQTEFVYIARCDYSTVHLCGDWSDWRPIAMSVENDKQRVWSVITPVPSGYCEFCYIADGHVTISRKHPTTSDCSRNWRNVYGPPSTAAKAAWKESFHVRLHRSMDRLADKVRDFLVQEPKKREEEEEEEVSEDVSSLDMQSLFRCPVSIRNVKQECEVKESAKVSLEKKCLPRILLLSFRFLLFCSFMYALVLLCFSLF